MYVFLSHFCCNRTRILGRYVLCCRRRKHNIGILLSRSGPSPFRKSISLSSVNFSQSWHRDGAASAAFSPSINCRADVNDPHEFPETSVSCHERWPSQFGSAAAAALPYGLFSKGNITGLGCRSIRDSLGSPQPQFITAIPLLL